VGDATSSHTVIVALSYGFAREHAAALLGVSQGVEWDDWTSEELLTELPDKWTLSWVALGEGEVITGYLIASAKPHPHVHRLMVSEQRRGEGLGRLLMQAFLERCRRLGGDTASIKVHESNIPSLRLQQSLGFEAVGTSSTGYVELRKVLG